MIAVLWLIVNRTRAGKADPALGAAVNDKEPVRRVAAAMVLGKGKPEERKVVYPLLNDPEPRVRFHAAAALLGGGYLLFIDTLARTAAPVEIPLGILTAVIGTPFFIWLLAGMQRTWS